MDLFLIILLVIVLYWRTMDYYYLIDDIVRRWGFLLEIPETSPPPQFFSVKPPKAKHLFLTLTHAANVSVIYFLWGPVPAALFAFHPLAVSCTAWVTGGYYQCTLFLTLTAYFFLVKIPGLWGAVIGMTFFTAALGSTINCLTVPFLFLFFPPLTGLSLFFPLFMYLTGRRFQIGFRKRNIGKGDKITWKKLVVVPKVLAYYIKDTVWPAKLAFFREYGFEYGKTASVKDDLESVNREFWESLAVIAGFCVFGLLTSPFGLCWYLFALMPFTQWKVLGQFVAERYTHLPLLGWALMLGAALSSAWAIPVLCVILAFYVWRSHQYIPAFQNIETLYENGVKQFPRCISNYVNLAERKLHTGKMFEAYELLKKGLQLDPKSFLCHANMAAYWLSINQPERGKYHTQMAMRFSENKGMAYAIFRQQLNHINDGMGKMAEARKAAEKILAEVRAEEEAKDVALAGLS